MNTIPHQQLEGPGSERRARTLRERFAAASASYDWRFDSWQAPWRRPQLIAHYLIPSALGVAGAFAAMWFYDLSAAMGSPSLAVRHLWASRGCSEARDVGLTPARRGQAGYWPQLDGDSDGLSCERWLPER